MSDSSDVITIKAIARHNVQTLLVSGVFGMALSALVANFFWHDYRMQIVLVFLVSFVCLLVGIFKHFEPQNSFELRPEQFSYCHRYGHLNLAWDNMMRIDIPKVTEGVETKALPYIGIKLKDSEVLAKLPRRLANNLLLEQRDLYFLACQIENLGLFDRQINDSPFKLANKNKVIGPVGAFLHRCEMLRKTFGYDVFIPVNACDREPEAFIELLKQCQSSADGHVSA